MSPSVALIGVALAACSGPQAQVVVAPHQFDPSSPEQSWYVEVTERRPGAGGVSSYPPQLVHRGFVCGDDPAQFLITTPCAQRAELTGEVWRVSHQRCGTHPGVVYGMLGAEDAVLIAKLEPVTLWPDRSPQDCDRGAAPSYEVGLRPPIDREATSRQFWLNHVYWVDPVYQLEIDDR